ncbi:hypothetical protein R5H32_16535 [Defluviimonas sp. D31]|nr:hypothetical protein [Defluviimonas sp. D31]MDW4550970.1 hypothetical protein [Defluviimonas sp. D31]
MAMTTTKTTTTDPLKTPASRRGFSLSGGGRFGQPAGQGGRLFQISNLAE